MYICIKRKIIIYYKYTIAESYDYTNVNAAHLELILRTHTMAVWEGNSKLSFREILSLVQY